MDIYINRYAYPITSLGPGKRITLWVQGCSRQCPGCASSDTWNRNNGLCINVNKLGDKISKIIIDENLDGFTITGGEPVEQAEPLVSLIKIVKNNVKTLCMNNNFDILMFSGYQKRDIEKISSGLINEIDVMVCGEYDYERSRSNRLVATDNQELIILNNDVNDLYQKYITEENVPLQFEIGANSVSFVGMPNAGDLKKIEEKLNSKGIILGGKSWEK